MTWWDDLPRIKAENEAWRREHLPRLREIQAKQERERNRANQLLNTFIETLSKEDGELVNRVFRGL